MSFLKYKRKISDSIVRCPGDGQFPAGSFDSLGAVEMANSLSTALSLKLPQTLVFDYPSVRAMSDHIHSLTAPAASSEVAITRQPVITRAPRADNAIQVEPLPRMLLIAAESNSLD